MPNRHAHRLTSRVLLFDERDRLLLFLTAAPDTSRVARWITPGGGVDPGEDHATAALRELYEETGLVLDDVGAPVFSEDFVVEWDDADHDTGHVEFYVAHSTAFDPSSEHWTDDERVDVVAHRWWTLDELDATHERYEPLTLPALARRVLNEEKG
jgi:8-oxo-dGTP pyrophosphatase MutT (NUDIX family)